MREISKAFFKKSKRGIGAKRKQGDCSAQSKIVTMMRIANIY